MYLKSIIWSNVSTQLALPGEYLVIAILEVPLKMFPDRVNQLVLMKIQNFVCLCKVTSQ